jgi:hypothetical protein
LGSLQRTYELTTEELGDVNAKIKVMERLSSSRLEVADDPDDLKVLSDENAELRQELEEKTDTIR